MWTSCLDGTNQIGLFLHHPKESCWWATTINSTISLSTIHQWTLWRCQVELNQRIKEEIKSTYQTLNSLLYYGKRFQSSLDTWRHPHKFTKHLGDFKPFWYWNHGITFWNVNTSRREKEFSFSLESLSWPSTLVVCCPAGGRAPGPAEEAQGHRGRAGQVFGGSEGRTREAGTVWKEGNWRKLIHTRAVV